MVSAAWAPASTFRDSDKRGVAKWDFEPGQAPDGRPYFAMEYIDGVPITEYCDRHR